MKLFNLIFLLIFNLLCFNNLTNASVVADLEIDGYSIGQKLTDKLSEKYIKNNIQPYFEDERQYYIVYSDKNLETFNDLEIYLKTNDTNYTIKSINAGLYPDNLDDCLKKQNQIVSDISKELNIQFNKSSGKHSYYKNTINRSYEAVIDGGYISIECLYFDKKDKKLYPNLADNLAIHVMSNEIVKWFESGYK